MVVLLQVGLGMAAVKKAGTDAFCKLSFAGGKSLKSKTVTVHGTTSTQINPEFNIEMWYPVSIPTMTQLIKFRCDIFCLQLPLPNL